MTTPVTGEAGPCSASYNQPCVQFESRDSLYMREEGWRDSGGDPKAGSATIIPLREDVFRLLVLALPRPSTSQMEARGQCLTSLCRPHMSMRHLGLCDPFLLRPLWHGRALSLRRLGDCPRHAAVCSAAHSSHAPGS